MDFVREEGDVDSIAADSVAHLFKSLQVLSNVVLSMAVMTIKYRNYKPSKVVNIHTNILNMYSMFPNK